MLNSSLQSLIRVGDVNDANGNAHGAEQADHGAAADDGEILNVVPLSSGVNHLPPELNARQYAHSGNILNTNKHSRTA
jgi:hypothetical protein